MWQSLVYCVCNHKQEKCALLQKCSTLFSMDAKKVLWNLKNSMHPKSCSFHNKNVVWYCTACWHSNDNVSVHEWTLKLVYYVNQNYQITWDTPYWNIINHLTATRHFWPPMYTVSTHCCIEVRHLKVFLLMVVYSNGYFFKPGTQHFVQKIPIPTCTYILYIR